MTSKVRLGLRNAPRAVVEKNGAVDTEPSTMNGLASSASTVRSCRVKTVNVDHSCQTSNPPGLQNIQRCELQQMKRRQQKRSKGSRRKHRVRFADVVQVAYFHTWETTIFATDTMRIAIYGGVVCRRLDAFPQTIRHEK